MMMTTAKIARRSQQTISLALVSGTLALTACGQGQVASPDDLNSTPYMMHSGSRKPLERLYLAAVDSSSTLGKGPERDGNDVLVGVGCRGENEDPNAMVTVPASFGSSQRKSVRLRDRVFLHEFLNSSGGGTCDVVFGSPHERLRFPSEEPARGSDFSLGAVTFSQVAGAIGWGIFTLEMAGYALKAAPTKGPVPILVRNADKLHRIGQRILNFIFTPELAKSMGASTPKILSYLLGTAGFWGMFSWAQGGETNRYVTANHQNTLWQYMATVWRVTDLEFAGTGSEKRYNELKQRYIKHGDVVAGRQAVSIKNVVFVKMANRYLDLTYPDKLMGRFGPGFLEAVKDMAKQPVQGVSDNFFPR